jgi:hypothetical protein
MMSGTPRRAAAGFQGGKRSRLALLTAGLIAGFGFTCLLERAVLAAPATTPDEKAEKAEKPEPAKNEKGSADQQIIAFINEQVRAQWKANSITPSGPCTDYEYIRRASIDIVGRIATVKEVDHFMADPAHTRRAQLIERLLNSPEYSKNWANMWTTWLLTRAGNPVYHEQMRRWLEEKFDPKTPTTFKEIVYDLLTATGKTNENGAVNYILSHLGEQTPAAERMKEGQFEMVPITSRTTRLFLGLQTQCTQCHDHPFNPQWKQKHFWGVNAFFRQVERKGVPNMMTANQNMAMAAAKLELVDNPEFNKDGVVFFERRNGIVSPTRPEFLDGTKMSSLGEGISRRQALANLVTTSPYFPKAIINRYWGHFFGRGFTNPIDDFGEHNPVSHPELLDKLAEEYVHYGFDQKRLIRWICNSDAYQLSSRANKTNEKSDAEVYFGRMILKSMSPEQLFDSLMTATQAPDVEIKEVKQKLRDRWMKALTVNFGDDEGNEVTFNGTVVQALMMMNGPELNEAISGKGTLANAVSKGKTMDVLFLATLNRPPTSAERSKLMAALHGGKNAPQVKDKDGMGPWQDLFWALLNSNEFIFNH